MASVGKRTGEDEPGWASFATVLGEDRHTYSVLCEMECCQEDHPDKETMQAFLVVTPAEGRGAGAIIKALESEGLRVIQMTKMPIRFTEEEYAEKFGGGFI